MDDELRPGDVVQINPLVGDILDCWRGVFMLVEEVKVWGIVAVTFSPQAGDMGPPGRFYLRLRDNPDVPNYFRIGKCPMIPDDIAEKLFPDLAKENGDWFDAE